MALLRRMEASSVGCDDQLVDLRSVPCEMRAENIFQIYDEQRLAGEDASPSAFRPGELSRAPLVPATLVSHQPVATDWLRAPIILRALHPGCDHACQRS